MSNRDPPKINLLISIGILLMEWKISARVIMFSATLSNISAISWWSV